MSQQRPIKLMNSAMMPASGTYHCEQISEAVFAMLLKVAAADCGVESFIGYQDNIDKIREITGIEVPMNRAPTDLVDGDEILAMRRAFEHDQARSKHERTSDPIWQYFLIDYKAFQGRDGRFAA